MFYVLIKKKLIVINNNGELYYNFKNLKFS